MTCGQGSARGDVYPGWQVAAAGPEVGVQGLVELEAFRASQGQGGLDSSEREQAGALVVASGQNWTWSSQELRQSSCQ